MVHADTGAFRGQGKVRVHCRNGACVRLVHAVTVGTLAGGRAGLRCMGRWSTLGGLGT